MADAMKKGYEEVQQMLSTYVPPPVASSAVTVPKELYQYDHFDTSMSDPLLESGVERGDVTQSNLENQLVGVTRPTGRRKLRSMGEAPEVRVPPPIDSSKRLDDYLDRKFKLNQRDIRRAIREDEERQRRTRGKYPFPTVDWKVNPRSREMSYDRARRRINLGLKGWDEEDVLGHFYESAADASLPNVISHELGHHFQNTVPFFPTGRLRDSGAYGGNRLAGQTAINRLKRAFMREGPEEVDVPDREVRDSLEDTYATELPAYAMMNLDTAEIAEALLGQTKRMTVQETPKGKYPSPMQRVLANLPQDAMDKQTILDLIQSDYPHLSYSQVAGLKARLGYLPPPEEWDDAIEEQEEQDARVRTLRALGGRKNDIIDLLARNPNYVKTGEPMEIAWQLLKDMKDSDGPLRRFYNMEQDQKNLQTREDAHVAALTPQIDETPVPETPMVDMPDGFFGNHAHERLTDQDRVMDEQEEQEVRSRITEAMQPYVDERGNFKLGAPKQIAIRTHLLDEHRQPDEAMSLSNGNSIVGIVRPHRKNKLKPDLHTVMLRRSELSHQPQPFTPDALRVDAVVNNHGIPKKRFKRMVRDHRRTLRRAEPMDIAFQLLKDDDKNRTIEEAFDLGQEILPYDKLHDKQKQIVDAIANAPPSYWNDPASGELETENYAGMFENDRQHFYPDEAFNQYLRYIQHFHDASSKVNELPHEKQMEIMSHYDNFQEEHPLHPAKVALDKMAEEHEDWGGANPHEDFWQRYNEPQMSMDFSETHKSKPMDIAFRLLKERKSPEAFANKKKYDSEYQKTPKRVKYREQLNAERRKRGIYGKGGKDVSHTQGGKLTLESPHLNRARHFKNRGTLRRVK